MHAGVSAACSQGNILIICMLKDNCFGQKCMQYFIDMGKLLVRYKAIIGGQTKLW